MWCAVLEFASLVKYWKLKPGEGNESCAVNHSLPHRWRGETHAESNNCIQNTPPQHTIKSNTSPPYWMQSAAQMLPLDEGLSHANWMTHFHSLLFYFLTRTHISQAGRFPFGALCALAYLFSQTCTYDCQNWKMLEGEDAKWKSVHTKTHCDASSFPCLTHFDSFLDLTWVAVNVGQF